MQLPYVATPEDFPSPAEALDDPNGLLALGNVLSPELLVAAYQQGIFPWFEEDQPVLWWSPDPRIGCSLPHPVGQRSMRKFCRNTSLKVTINHAFDEVIQACANERAGNTWILPVMCEAYGHLHRLGHAHSVEVWDEDTLVGGLYGIAVGAVFCGESMFHRTSNASKLAFYSFAQHFSLHDGCYIDGQIENPHLISLGMQPISREDFGTLLHSHRERPISLDCWRPQTLALPL
ncbi:leucyl/phenylalanyl-tRNA--protein transferase [Aliagarivorans marinus]|uniref:leucyl/phenylalanyl-tRNA--protein transferase n=1 Tax=Aliagarivorans marinus TaxID=561965 RepID=UPI00040902FD|nr:leucyl/phenylalanyl-tRNA--protein transferase [Aliagarivorans marinus]